jgi:UDP-2-acetamido-2,6-beta-L-arabino-hexul-4-ose reductase
MVKIGITGQAGFVGTHLYMLGLFPEEFERIDFKKSVSDSTELSLHLLNVT